MGAVGKVIKWSFGLVGFFVVAIIVISILVAALGGGEEIENSPSAGSSDNSGSSGESAGGSGSGSGSSREASAPGSGQEDPVAMGEIAEIGDVSWQVTSVSQTDTVGDEFDSMSGNFVVVDFAFTNNSNETKTLDSGSLRIVDDQGRENEANIDASMYIPLELDVFLEEVNPGVTEEGRVIYDVAPDAAGMVLQANDAGMFSENYTYLALE